MTLYTRRLTWLVILLLATAFAVTLFSDATVTADAAPSETGVLNSSRAADPIPPWGDYPPGRKSK